MSRTTREKKYHICQLNKPINFEKQTTETNKFSHTYLFKSKYLKKNYSIRIRNREIIRIPFPQTDREGDRSFPDLSVKSCRVYEKRMCFISLSLGARGAGGGGDRQEMEKGEGFPENGRWPPWKVSREYSTLILALSIHPHLRIYCAPGSG